MKPQYKATLVRSALTLGLTFGLLVLPLRAALAHDPIIPRDLAAEAAGDLSAALGAIALLSLGIFFCLDKVLDLLVRQRWFAIGFWVGKVYSALATLTIAVAMLYFGVLMPSFARTASLRAAHDTAATVIVAAPVTPEQRALFLVPGGAYTNADIAANGGVTPDQKWRGMMANHHLKASKGAILCPITRTQANPKFPWVVGGKKYLFCCPPCVAEFVKSAKTSPKSLKAPESYVQK